MTEIITSSSNPLLKQARALRQKKGRDESGFFLVEGILHVGEAVEAGWQVETVLYAPERLKSDFALQLLDGLVQRGIRCQPLSYAAFESFAEKENPQGIAALVRQRSLSLEAFSAADLPFITALVAPQDPGNVGTILRTLDAVGVDGLALLDGGVDLYHPSVVRASMGTLFWKSIFRLDFDAFIAWARGKGYRIIGTSAHGTQDYRSLALDDQPTVLLLGNEQKGLLPAQLDACDMLVSLPMRGRASSLNLSIAAGVLLYTFMG